MTISKSQNGTETVIEVAGRVDTNTAPELDEAIKESIKDSETIVIDLKETVYVSSAVLRVLLRAHKSMTAKGGVLKIMNANENVMGIFKATGFADILNLE